MGRRSVVSLLHVDVDLLLNAVLDAVVIPSLDGEDVGSVQRRRDLVLQSRIAGSGDNRVVEIGLHPGDRFRREEDLRVDVERAAHIGLILRRNYVDSGKARTAFRRASVGGIRVFARDAFDRTVSVPARIGGGSFYGVGDTLLRTLHRCAHSPGIAIGNTVDFFLRQQPVDVEADASNRRGPGRGCVNRRIHGKTTPEGGGTQKLIPGDFGMEHA
jgi:hypothetical protein